MHTISYITTLTYGTYLLVCSMGLMAVLFQRHKLKNVPHRESEGVRSFRGRGQGRKRGSAGWTRTRQVPLIQNIIRNDLFRIRLIKSSRIRFRILLWIRSYYSSDRKIMREFASRLFIVPYEGNLISNKLAYYNF
jgi:hypothetical protein